MTISLICACKNRNEALQIALNSWLLKKEITEIIIVDWSSDEPLASFTKLDKRIKVITVQNQKYFNQPQPLNLAASIATGDYILKVDCDYVFSPYYNFFETYQIDENSFVSGKHNIKNYDYFNETTQSFVVDKDKMSFRELVEYVNSYSPIFKYLIGLLFISRQNFEKVGGYNEKLGKYYAYEDDEMFHRLRVLGLNEIKLNFDYNILHIPHPDKKRTENFEGYDSQQLNYIKDSLSDEDHKVKEWNAEYLLSQKHIEENKKIAPLTDNYYTIPLTEWNLQKIDEQNYYAHKIMKTNKLENFPSVYYVSLEESTDRQKNLERQFAEYGITPTAIISKRYSESDDEITGKFLDQMNGGTIGCAVSHLKAIRKWYEETDEEYAFFCEDDLSLETIQYWDFTWEEFIETIPEGSLYVQLLLIRDNYETFEIRKKLWDDWAATAYILTREYAKLLVDSYCLGEKKFHLEIPGVNNYAVPLVENILFETIDKGGAAVPLFVEDVNFGTTFSPEEDNEVVNNQKGGHYEARETVLNYWKNKMKSPKITKQEEPKDFKMNQIEYLLSEYANDSENAESNLKLGAWYWNQKHSAPALSYFLRCAERAEDPTLAYEALLWSHLCYEIQGTRDATARTLLQHAIHELPNRPEAYYLLAKFHSKREQWTDTYIVATQGLTLTEKDLPPLRNDIGYVGEYALLYEKAVSGWWWGKNIESGLIFKDLHENHRMQEEYRNKVLDNLQKYFPNLLVPPNFDWGNTDPEYVEMFSNNNSTEGSVDVVEVSESEKMDIVLQGKYEEYTDEIIDEYLRVPFVNNVIVSCWDDDRPEHYHSSKVKYVRSVYPLSSGTCNKNLQITTSFAGIKLCKTKFSAKMRSDQKYNYNSMVNMYEFLMENHTEGKIFVAGMFPYLLFHPRDHIYWGTTENLYQLFDIPLEYNSLIDKVRIGKYELAQYTNYFTRPETYIGAHYCARFDDCVKKMLIEPEKYLYDDAINWQDAKDFSDRITPLVFKSFSRKCIDFDWTCKPGFTVQSYLDVCSWYEDDSNIN
jgi:hypothetical protein